MNPIPSPVAENGMVFAMSGFQGSGLKAIRLADAKGDITGAKAIAWTLDRDTPYVPSPLLYDGVLYILKSNAGILSVFDAKTGRPHYRLQRLDGIPEVYSSPVGGAGPRVHHRPRRDHARDPPRPSVRGAGQEHARRRLRCVGGAGRREHLPARIPLPVQHRRALSAAGA